MKTLIYCIALVLCAGFSQAQNIELEEARINFQPVTLIDENSFSVSLRETYRGEFEKDPVAFVENNFDIKQIISQVENDGREYDSYLGTFRSRKGELMCEFDNGGLLLSSSLRLENIFVPRAIANMLYRDYKGWTMIKNVHEKSIKNGVVKKDTYHITMKNDKQRKKLKIDAQKDISTTVVIN